MSELTLGKPSSEAVGLTSSSCSPPGSVTLALLLSCSVLGELWIILL